MKFQEIAERKRRMLAEGLPAQQVMEQIMSDILTYRKKQSTRLNGIMKIDLLCCDAEAQTIRMGFPVEEWELNPAGTLHGGMFATAVDIAMGMLAHYYGEGQVCTTVSMTVNYLRPVQQGDMLVVEACVEKRGLTLMNMTAKGWCASDRKTTVTGSGTYMVLDRQLD